MVAGPQPANQPTSPRKCRKSVQRNPRWLEWNCGGALDGYARIECRGPPRDQHAETWLRCLNSKRPGNFQCWRKAGTIQERSNSLSLRVRKVGIDIGTARG